MEHPRRIDAKHSVTDPAPPVVLDYGDSSASGPSGFDRFIGTLLFVLCGICLLCALIVVLWLIARHRFSPSIILCAAVGVSLVLGMAYALFCAGRLVWTSERRQG